MILDILPTAAQWLRFIACNFALGKLLDVFCGISVGQCGFSLARGAWTFK
jgi:hypothetical protein